MRGYCNGFKDSIDLIIGAIEAEALDYDTLGDYGSGFVAGLEDAKNEAIEAVDLAISRIDKTSERAFRAARSKQGRNEQ